jgi:DNA-binding transcriptional regulator YhcF (GntR family)
MRSRVKFKSGKPVYSHVMEQVKAAAASGELRPGEALTPEEIFFAPLNS